MFKLLITLAALMTPTLATAASSVSLSSAVFIEKTVADQSGQSKTVLQEPKVVTPGDRLIFILSYRNDGTAAATAFVVTNPLPNAVAYQGTPDKSAVVSIDGGKIWGSLETLKAPDGAGRWRSARAEDVTHIRWAMQQPIPAGAQGKFSFRGIVR